MVPLSSKAWNAPMRSVPRGWKAKLSSAQIADQTSFPPFVFPYTHFPAGSEALACCCFFIFISLVCVFNITLLFNAPSFRFIKVSALKFRPSIDCFSVTSALPSRRARIVIPMYSGISVLTYIYSRVRRSSTLLVPSSSLLSAEPWSGSGNLRNYRHYPCFDIT